MDVCAFLFTIAWDGTDENGHAVEIESDNLVRVGNDIEVFDYTDGEYKDVSVEDITRYGNTVEIEAFDYSTGETITYTMED